MSRFLPLVAVGIALCIPLSAQTIPPSSADGLRDGWVAKTAALKSRLTRVIKAYEDLSDELRLDTVPDEFEGKTAAEEGMDRLGARLEDASREAAALTEPSDDRWRAVGERLERLEDDLEHLRLSTRRVGAYALVRKRLRKPAWAVGVETSRREVMQDAGLFAGAFTGEVLLEAVRGKAASAQLVVMPLTRDISNVRVLLPAVLVGPPGSVLHRSDLELNNVGRVGAEQASDARPAEARWRPDVLLGYEPISVRQSEVRPFMLTIHVPRDAKPGAYHGRITLTARAAHTNVVDIRLRVDDVEPASL